LHGVTVEARFAEIVRCVAMRIPSSIEENGKTPVRGSILHDEQQPTSPRILQMSI
jgi:hypothetical protein